MLLIAYGVVIPRSCIGGMNEQSIGFGTTLFGRLLGLPRRHSRGAPEPVMAGGLRDRSVISWKRSWHGRPGEKTMRPCDY
jgi:hypothetical protein